VTDTSDTKGSERQSAAPGREHVRHLLAAEYARCVALVENCDMELEKTRLATEEWTKERRKWAERAFAVSAELGDDIPPIPPRAQSELTDAWEFDTRGY